MRNVHAIRKYGVGLPVSFKGYTSTSTLEWCKFHAFLRAISELSKDSITRKIKSMKKIILYIAASIDGYIAEAEGSTEWLEDYPITEKMNYGYNEFMASVDTIIMGGRSYREVLNMDIIGHYKDRQIYVVTRGWTEKTVDNVDFIMDNVINRIRQLRDGAGKNIWLFGGGKLTAMLLEADLIDEMRICYIPVILGEGIPLFPKQPKESKWKLIESKAYNSGILMVKYQRKK